MVINAPTRIGRSRKIAAAAVPPVAASAAAPPAPSARTVAPPDRTKPVTLAQLPILSLQVLPCMPNRFSRI
ncbi:hypothetical protein D3C72_1696390 [compost metagenome]